MSWTGFLGQTIQVALLHDTLYFCSSHIFLLYTIVAYIYNYILCMLITLINLFNGKKFNVMRNRVDSNNFSLQEFYLGVLIVALIIFLLPTLAMFYFLAFISLMISILFMQICLLIIQIWLTNFPFHLLKFVIKNPYIIPNSINIEPQSSHQNHIRMFPMPTDKGSVFKRLINEFKKMIKVIAPVKVIRSIIWGENMLLIMHSLLLTL